MTPEEREALILSIESYIDQAVRALFESKPDDFYYITLVTTGEAYTPVLSAWSRQALDAVPAADRSFLKWSYADSPYYHFGERWFDDLSAVFDQRASMSELSDSEWRAEVDARLDAMEKAMARLDARGLFGSGQQRDELVVAVEVMPPDASNLARVARLNEGGRLDEWLSEVAEPD